MLLAVCFVFQVTDLCELKQLFPMDRFFCDICFILQDEKNQLMTTNVWLKQVCVKY